MTNIILDISRPDQNDILQALKFSSATLHEAAGKIGALPSGIKPLSNLMKICGAAVTVHSPGIDNIMLHEAILASKPGDVLVVEVSGEYEAGYWGDIMTQAAKERQIQGLVIDGCVRDSKEIIAMDFPVFSRGICIRGTNKNGGGTINHPIQIGDVIISPGDLVVGDQDGIVVLPRKKVSEIVVKAEQREEHEKWISDELTRGKTTMEIYGWESKLNSNF
jgi:4-hydroxy-4-methyl-2-oxoglutarate aldolase